MKSPIFTVLGFFLGILLIVIGVLYFTSRRSVAAEKAQPAVPVAPAVPAPPPAETGKPKNPMLGKFFSYKEAVDGVIPSIPGTQQVRAGILVDLDTRQVLWSKNPRDGYPIASMTKMMTLLLIAEAMERNPELTLETPVKVSLAASKIGGSQVWLDPRESIPLGELLKAIAIKSANDAAYQAAEFVNSGDVAGFIGMMNRRARQLRMPSTAFVNPYGLKADDGRNSISSSEGMALLAEQLLEYPVIMEFCGMKSAGFRPEGSRGHLQMTSTNGLLGNCAGVDGLKTGYIKEAGFCITVTCLRGGKRMVVVLMGSPTTRDRNATVRQLLDWGYRRQAELNDPTTLAGAKKSGEQLTPPPLQANAAPKKAQRTAVKKNR